MKKFMAYLLLGGLFVIPTLVFASDLKVVASVSNTPISTETLDDNTTKGTYSISATLTGDATDSLSVFDFTFTYTGDKITKFKCEDAGNFKVESEKEVSTGEVRCVYKASDANAIKASTSGTSAEVARVSVTVNDNSTDDCTVSVKYNGSDGKSNPDTGVSIPYVAVLSGVVLAGAVYIVTKRNTKLYKI